MINSLKRYCRLFFITFFLKKEKTILLNHAWSYYITKSFLRKTYSNKEKEKTIQLTINWLLSAQQQMTNNGFGTYYIVDGWSSSYPETSGYIIPTLYQYLQYNSLNKTTIEDSIIKCANWLVDIQKQSGGWQSFYIEHNRPEVVFNTGQIVRGLIIAHKITNDEKYKLSIVKASNWLVQTQEEEGSWIKTASMQQPRVYDSYVAHPLLMAYKLTGNENYKQAAIKNLDWIINTQQTTNGWFTNADNTEKHNEKPILHTIAYTIDGLINCGNILENKKYIEKATLAADKILKIFERDGYLNGRFDKNWNGSEYIICTGCAQMSIIWAMLYDLTKDKKYANAVTKMNNQLVYIQQSSLVLKGVGNGALPGSFPIWGKYEPFAFPNWASKYFADALMGELKLNN